MVTLFQLIPIGTATAEFVCFKARAFFPVIVVPRINIDSISRIFLQIPGLVIYEDKEMPAPVYREVPKLLHSTKCKTLAFANCNLSFEKLHEFGSEYSELGMSVSDRFPC